jgi:hypothetical protein
MLHKQITDLIYQELCNNNLDNVEKLNNLLCSISSHSHIKSTAANDNYVDYEVEYLVDGDFQNPNILFYLDTENIKCYWDIANARSEYLESWKNMRTCMISNKIFEFIGGEIRDSCWNCKCDSKNFIIEFYVSDVLIGCDSYMHIIIPNSKMILYIDKIIDILEHAKQNKCYPNSTILN